MTDEEKKLLQAKHRLEEAQARERSAGKVLPEVQAVGLDNLEEYLRRKLAGYD